MINIYQPVSGGGGGLTIGTTPITSGTSTRLLFDAAGVVSETDGATWDATNKALTVGGATVTTSNPVLNLSQTWNDGAVTFTGLKLNVTNTASSSSSYLMDLQVGGVSAFWVQANGRVQMTGTLETSGTVSFNGWSAFGGNNGEGLTFGSASGIHWVSASSSGVYQDGDTSIIRSAAGVVGVRNGTTGGGAIELLEQTAPSAGASNTVRLYAEDNGSGKTRLMALFASGAAQQVAIEP